MLHVRSESGEGGGDAVEGLCECSARVADVYFNLDTKSSSTFNISNVGSASNVGLPTISMSSTFPSH
jgi:hypothetical protein